MSIVPDTKDWTWVLDARCTDCDFEAADVTTDDLGARLRASAKPWAALLGDAQARERWRPDVWSVLEYACHVRDVHRKFDERIHLMLDHDDPQFPNWDQDTAAVVGSYADQDPDRVAVELAAAAERVASSYDDVPAESWGRVGRRDDGSVFTVASLGQYHLHDAVHHLWDVRHGRTVV